MTQEPTAAPPPAPEPDHPLYAAYVAAWGAWTAALVAEGGMVGFRRIRQPTNADATVAALHTAAKAAYRAWRAAGSPRYVIIPKPKA